ncbi:hypothetical protein FQN50_007574 [Emmonsiellopsis sp. PD_5]|nr:hypothetical protein FQN50_007574 [Emmonsiellopsis sp. PD_5]
MSFLIICLTLLLPLANAHFSVTYPYWRGDSFATQWERPCGGVNVTSNRTEWPLDGGSVLFKPSHPWAITYVNLGLGSDESVVFNISLIEGFNQTGNGTLCFPKVPIPSDLGLATGANASIQIIQLTELGSALYNCADITLSEDAKLLSDDQCTNSTGIGWQHLEGDASTTGSAPSPTPSAGAGSTLLIGQPVMNIGLCAVAAMWLGQWLL